MAQAIGAPALLLLALLSPSAAAFGVVGELRFDEPALLAGAGAVAADEGFLDLDPTGAGTLRLAWDGGRAEVVERVDRRAAFQGHSDGPPRRAVFELPAGILGGVQCAAPCVFEIRVPDGGAGRLSAEGNLSGALAPLVERGPPGASAALSPLGLTPPLEEEWFAARSPGRGEGGLSVARPTLLATGDLKILLYGVTATVRNGTAEETWWSGVRDEPTVAGVPGDVSGERRTRAIVLHLHGARLEWADAAFTLRAPALDVDLQGSLESPRATGWVEAEGTRRDVADERVRLAGRLGAAAFVQASPLAPRGGAGLEGDATSLQVAGEDVRPAAFPLPSAPVAGAAVAAIGLAALLLVLLKSSLGVSLYSRITRGSVLAQPSRLAIYETVRARPGLHTTEIGRLTGMGRIVVRHHLRTLEGHGLLVGRSMGRVRAYYPVGALPEQDQMAAGLALKDPTRLAVARAVAAAPEGVTQRDLVERLGMGQRLASYHLHHLQHAGLIAGDGGRPQRFKATPMLPGLLGPDVGGIAA